jgi:uncharacterized protein involved in type VI secretion and phage assembly
MNGKSKGPPFYGKYRGIVTNNKDPNNLGRLRATVHDVLGENESGWAIPCTPYAGNDVGLFLIPPEKASVWIEFEHGDPERPIWTGCFWAFDNGTAIDKLPASPAVPDMKVLKTDVGTITLNDTSGSASITIETQSKMKIVFDKNGIEIRNNSQKIKISGRSISINDGALEVT